MEENICKNCDCQTNGNYCSNCGHPVKLKKIDRDHIIHEIKDAIFADKGFLYTTKKVLLTPGDSVKYYITEDRSRFVKPITYILITSLIYALVTNLFKIDYLAQLDTSETTPTMNSISRWMMDNHGYTSIIINFFMAFWIKLFFKKYGYNLFEIYILLCYVGGIEVLLVSVASIFLTLIHVENLLFLNYSSMIFSVWAIGQFFDKNKAKSYIKAFFSYILGIFVIGIIAFLGAIIEFLIR